MKKKTPTLLKANPQISTRGHKVLYRRKGAYSSIINATGFDLFSPKGKLIGEYEFEKNDLESNKTKELAVYQSLNEYIQETEEKKRKKQRKKKALKVSSKTKKLPKTGKWESSERFFFSKRYNEFIETKSFNWDFESNILINDNNREQVAELLKSFTRKKLEYILDKKQGEGKKFFLIINHKADIAVKRRRKKIKIPQQGYSNRRTLLTLDTLDRFLDRYFTTGWVDSKTQKTFKESYTEKAADYLSRLISANMYITGITVEMLVSRGSPESKKAKKAKQTKKPTAKKGKKGVQKRKQTRRTSTTRTRQRRFRRRR